MKTLRGELYKRLLIVETAKAKRNEVLAPISKELTTINCQLAKLNEMANDLRKKRSELNDKENEAYKKYLSATEGKEPFFVELAIYTKIRDHKQATKCIKQIHAKVKKKVYGA